VRGQAAPIGILFSGTGAQGDSAVWISACASTPKREATPNARDAGVTRTPTPASQ